MVPCRVDMGRRAWRGNRVLKKPARYTDMPAEEMEYDGGADLLRIAHTCRIFGKIFLIAGAVFFVVSLCVQSPSKRSKFKVVSYILFGVSGLFSGVAAGCTRVNTMRSLQLAQDEVDGIDLDASSEEGNLNLPRLA